VAGDDELLFGVDPELLAGHRGDRRDTERGRPDHECRRVGDQLGQEILLHALLRRAQA
jgi:hypothetical protein